MDFMTYAGIEDNIVRQFIADMKDWFNGIVSIEYVVDALSFRGVDYWTLPDYLKSMIHSNLIISYPE